MTGPDLDQLTRRFTETTGSGPEGIWSAPGRVNLIGEHTDYNDGHVLPFAVAARTAAAVRRRSDGIVRVVSLQQDDAAECALDRLRHARGWSAYVLGTVWALAEAGLPVEGLDVVVDGTVPLGAGLSSSAALECAVALALDELYRSGLSRVELARAGQRAEHDVVGAPVGLMDQAASMLCTAGSALLLDCRSTTSEQVPLDPDAGGMRLLLADTRVHHDLADGRYAARRRECEQASAILGVPALRDAGPEQVAAAADDLGPVLLRRARHVVTEQQRVHAAVAALRAGAWARLGPLLTASHESLRDDYEVSVAELDGVVDAARLGGALGARMTGGGFGGNVVALVPEQRVEAVHGAILDRAARERWPVPAVGIAAPGGGARRER